MVGGLRARLLGVETAGGLKLSTSIASPSGLLITIVALFRVGLGKARDGVELRFGWGV
jgi:hypothetical protein